jgi:hypothetical protein
MDRNLREQAMRKAGLWMMGVGVTGLVACAEVEYPYRYISLEQVPGIRVDRTTKVTQEKLRGNSAMAVEYSLEREHYTLHFSVVQGSLHPALKVAIEGGNYSVQFRRDMNVRAPDGTICASFYPATAASFDFGWAPECTDPGLPKVIDFEVRNGGGETVAQESIVFSLKENGVYSATDVI